MAAKRMFLKTLIDNDNFTDMPLSSQCLYFHLALQADDDGFVSNAKKIQRSIGATLDDMKLLIAKGYVITFQTGVIVIAHWRLHNTIQNDRYHRTIYQDEYNALLVTDSNEYKLKMDSEQPRFQDVSKTDTDCIQNVSDMDTQIRLDKNSIDKDSIDKGSIEEDSLKGEPKRKRFVPPTLPEVQAYCFERGNNVDAEHFIDYYSSNGWKVGKNPMKDWKAAIRTWEKNGYSKKTTNGCDRYSVIDDAMKDYDDWKGDIFE